MPEYFTLNEFRTLPQMGDSNKYPDARINLAAAYVTAIVDREIFGDVNGQLVGFVGRPITEVLDGDGTDTIVLGTPYARTVTALTVGGVVTSFATMLLRDGVLRWGYDSGGRWTVGRGNVSVTYTAGYGSADVVPGDIKEAVMQATRARLLSTSSSADYSDRRTSLTTDQGTIGFVVAGEDQPTGYPEVDAVILGWRERAGFPGFS